MTALLLATTLLVGVNGPLANGMGIGRPAVVHAQRQGPPPPLDPTAGTTSVLHQPHFAAAAPFTAGTTRPAMPARFQPAMPPGTLTLSATSAASFIGSDGRLEVDVPLGAVTASDLALAGGPASLRITEVASQAGSNAGGSGLISLGTYLIEVRNSQGTTAVQGLRVPVTLKLHYAGRDSTLDLDSAFVVFNGAHPKTITGLGAYSTQAVVHDRANHVLQVALAADATLSAGATKTRAPGSPIPALLQPAFTQQTPSTMFTWDTYAPVAKFGNPDPFNVDLNAGSLTEGIKLDVPPGPAGAMPNITLAYNSASVNEQHSPQGAAGWVGEGWSMSLGAISWAEHDQFPTCGTCGNTWQNTWQLNDPFGTSTELIPPNTTTSTYYDDSPYWYCSTGNASATPCPIQFHTARETHADVFAYVGPLTLGTQPDHPPCWRVYLPNGVMEEFGCTADSIQYYPLQTGTLPNQGNHDVFYPVNWLLDLITNPQGDQVHITYQSDTATAPDGLRYPRDLQMHTIEWDSPTCVNADQMCTSTWQPLYRVVFNDTQRSITRLTNTPANCNPDASVRCDDPMDATGGLKAPLVNGTLALNDIVVETNPTSGGSYNPYAWNTVRDYQLSYEQNGPSLITDPVTGKSEYAAGYLDLTKIQEVGTDGATAYPPTTMTYTTQTQYYEDGSFTPYSTSACGPSWNTGGNGGTCDLWSQSRDGNSRYLASASNGMGLTQAFSWYLARSNTHGAPGGAANSINPFYCTNNPNGYPCSEADDQAWSRVVVTQRQDAVVQLSQNGQGGAQTNLTVTSTYGYGYALAQYIAQECTDCKFGMYWGNQNDGDYLDYYHGVFMGFAQAAVSRPDGSVETHTYEAPEGWGVYDTSQGISCAASTLPPLDLTCHAAPWWHVANAGHGLETEVDETATDGVTLLKKVTSAYQAVCPPSGVAGSPPNGHGTWDGMLVSEVDPDNPVAVCEPRQTQQVTTTSEGTGNSVTDTESYTYDSLGHLIKTTSTASSTGNSVTNTIVHSASDVWNQGLNVPPPATSNTPQTISGTYILDATASTDTEDASQHQYSCQRASYDSQGFATGQLSALTKANPTEQDTYNASCGANPNGALTTKTTYDGYGNPASALDPVANSTDASAAAHVGAPGTTCAGTTSCTQYNSSQAQAAQSGNVFGKSSTITYGTGPGDASGGFGLWPTATTDANGLTTTYAYDPLGRMTSMRAPGQGSGPPTAGMTYANWCAATGAQAPCMEVDSTRRLDASTSVLTRQFYDGQNRPVETRTAAPGGQDVVQYTFYNAAGRAATSSVQYYVAAYSGAPSSAAYSIPDTSAAVAYSSQTYDGLGRMLSATDPLGNLTQVAYTIVCNAPGTGDSACYEQTLGTDANNHRHGSLADAFGRAIYDQAYSGNSPASYAVYSTTTTTYDVNGRVTKVLHPDGSHATTYTYDTSGRLTALSDPDRGSETYAYDANGNRTQTTDARGASGTVYQGYDGLNRPIWRNTSNSPAGAYDTWTYDGAANGSYGRGRVATEVFRSPSQTSYSGAYSYSYDALGRTTRTNQTMGAAGACPSGWTCADIGGPAQAGTQSAVGDGEWVVSGAGDIWGTSDQFHYVSQALAGDGTIAMRVDSQTVTSPFAKVELMVRASSDPAAAYYAVEVGPSGVGVHDRLSAGASAAQIASASGATPLFVQVTRSGTSYSAATSPDGVAWTAIPSSSASVTALSGSVLAGVAVASASTSAGVSTAAVDSVSVTTSGAGACPTGWTCGDIGAPGMAGTQSYVAMGQWTVSGAGDIWGTSDQFHYVYQSLPGDGSASARVSAQSPGPQFAKTEVMLRAGTAANAAFYAVELGPTGIGVHARTSTGGSVAQVATASGAPAIALKVTRSGTSFSAYTSSDGVTWSLIPSSTTTIAALSGSILQGVAVASSSATASSTATLDSLSPSAPPPASVSITSPAQPASATSYPVSQSYNDAGQLATQTYPDGETVTTSYTPQGWFAGLTTSAGGGTTLANTVTYSGAGGAFGQPTGMTVGNGALYTYSASFDALGRATDTRWSTTSGGAVQFEEQRGYDPVGNVASVSTTLAAGSDHQAFCYDKQNRLTWASSQSGAIPCGGINTAGTLTSASYTQPFSYDNLNRQLVGPGGSYSYNDPAHLHAATAIGSQWTAAYDAAGDMTCRAPSSATTCAGTPTGAQLSDDVEGHLWLWQASANNWSTYSGYLYDGEGQRVQQVAVTGSISTTTVYVGNLEALATTGSTTTTTDPSGARVV